MSNRTTVFFFEASGIASKYGIGTYSNSIIPKIIAHCEFRLIHIIIKFDKSNYVNRIKNSPIHETIQITFNITHTNHFSAESISPLIAKAIFCIISSELINKNTNIFHFNSNFHHELAKLAKKNNFKTVYTQHSSLWRNFYKNNFQNFSDNWNILENENRDRYSETLKKEKELCKDSDKVICLTDDSLDFTNDFYDIEKKKISLIYNGIDIDHVDITSNERKLLRLHYGFSADQILITYTGRIVKDKGISDLINAFKILIKKNPLVHLLLAGDGEIKHFSSNCTEINTHVTFTGFLNKEQLRDLYLISDIGVMPSLNEQTSYSVLEMMLYKLPVVISDIPGFKLPYINRKHVLKAKTVKTDQGILINNENLACCIEELTQDSALRNSLIENGFKLLKNKLNSNKMASKVIRIYQKLTYN